jgi:predicted HTH domain antitoxin
VNTVTVELERELAGLFHPAFGRPEDRIKEYLVLELYRRREVSSGKAAELLDMEHVEFIRYASRLGIPFLDMDEQELKDEIRTVRER